MPRKIFCSAPRRYELPDDNSIAIHCYKRLNILLIVGLTVRKIKEKKKLDNIEISFSSAKIQDGQGFRKLKTEAAHNLPRNILINGISLFEYINDPECNYRLLLKKQIYLLSAQTVIVSHNVNYVDSCWEKHGLLEVHKMYLQNCSKISEDSENEVDELTNIAQYFIKQCNISLDETFEVVKKRKKYIKEKESLTHIFQIYYDEISKFDYVDLVNKWIRIYKLPQNQ